MGVAAIMVVTGRWEIDIRAQVAEPQHGCGGQVVVALEEHLVGIKVADMVEAER